MILIFGIDQVEKMRLDYSGNFGIGTVPSYKFHVVGNTYLTGGWTEVDGVFYITNQYISTNASTNPLRFAINDSEKMRIAANGNVGINNNNPKVLLNIKPNASNNFTMVMDGASTAGGFNSINYSNSYAHNDILIGTFLDSCLKVPLSV